MHGVRVSVFACKDISRYVCTTGMCAQSSSTIEIFHFTFLGHILQVILACVNWDLFFSYTHDQSLR